MFNSFYRKGKRCAKKYLSRRNGRRPDGPFEIPGKNNPADPRVKILAGTCRNRGLSYAVREWTFFTGIMTHMIR